MRIPFLPRIRHPFYPGLKPAPAVTANQDTPALYGAFDDLVAAAGLGIRVGRAIFPVRAPSDPFLTERQRNALWDMFQVPVYTLLLDGSRSVIGYECEAHDGLHLSDDYRGGILFCRVESRLCECGRPGPRLMPPASTEWDAEREAEAIAG